MKIMSFNIRCGDVGDVHWYERIDDVSKTMLESGAATIGVQEATPQWMEALNKSIGHKYAYIGVGREDGINSGEYTAIFYLKDKYNLIDYNNFWISETPDVPSKGWDSACTRVCTWGIFENKETKETFMHINTHFDHIGVVARRKSVEMILSLAQSLPELPVVFTADMNVIEGTENYLQFVNSDYFYDTKYKAPDTMSYCTYHDTEPEKHADEVIDYVMVNDKWTVQTYKVMTEGIDGRYVSDHYPIYAELTINN